MFEIVEDNSVLNSRSCSTRGRAQVSHFHFRRVFLFLWFSLVGSFGVVQLIIRGQAVRFNEISCIRVFVNPSSSGCNILGTIIYFFLICQLYVFSFLLHAISKNLGSSAPEKRRNIYMKGIFNFIIQKNLWKIKIIFKRFFFKFVD